MTSSMFVINAVPLNSARYAMLSNLRHVIQLVHDWKHRHGDCRLCFIQSLISRTVVNDTNNGTVQGFGCITNTQQNSLFLGFFAFLRSASTGAIHLDWCVFSTTKIIFSCSVNRRSRTYALQTDRLKAHEKLKVDSIWLRICRKMIRNRFRRIGGENDETAIRFFLKTRR